MEYKTTDTSTLAGLRATERLLAAGWVVYRSGLFMVWLKRAKPA